MKKGVFPREYAPKFRIQIQEPKLGAKPQDAAKERILPDAKSIRSQKIGAKKEAKRGAIRSQDGGCGMRKDEMRG